MILFENAGEIDPRSITTFGVSSKENASAVGFFGTGLKYAIAILLREGCRITIHSGETVLEFTTRRDRIRVDEFDLVLMNGQPLGFTTELGKTWELWQAFRELYCNCKDEDGAHRELTPEETQALTPQPGRTQILVQGRKFAEVYRNRGEIILNTKPLVDCTTCSIHPGPSEYLFYRGVRASKLAEPSLFTYNIHNRVDLTEDRTIKYLFEAHAAIRYALLEGVQDSELVRKVVTAGKGTFEVGFNFNGVPPSETFLGVVRELAERFDASLSNSALEVCRPWLLSALPETGEELDDLERLRLDRATKFCRRLGFNVDDYPIVVTEWLGESVLGRAHAGRIYLSKRVFMMGTKMLAGTLIEEFLHLRHDLRDCDRTMQNFLFDTIVSLGERVVGEPL